MQQDSVTSVVLAPNPLRFTTRDILLQIGRFDIIEDGFGFYEMAWTLSSVRIANIACYRKYFLMHYNRTNLL